MGAKKKDRRILIGFKKVRYYKYMHFENNKLHEFTGEFKTKYDAAEWFLKWGTYWSAKNYDLKLIKFKTHESVFFEPVGVNREIQIL